MAREVPERVRHYLTTGMSATPATMATLLKSASEAELDARPYADRFTLREVVGHMADWEGVWRERLGRIVSEDTPFLPGYDEGQWAIDHDYAHMNVAEQLARLAAERQRLVAFLRNLDPAAWERRGRHGEMGEITLLEMASLVLGHDGYHTAQIIEYRGLGGPAGA